MDVGGLRSWGGTFAMGLAFPVAALVAAVLALATTPLTAGLVAGLVASLVPWALLAGEVRVGPWPMALMGVGFPGVVVALNDAPGAIFLGLLAATWLAADGRSVAAEATAAVAAAVALPLLYVAGQWSDEYEALVFFGTGGLFSWLLGRILRRERELVVALTEAQGRLDAAAAAAERQRIARDVHDAIGHGLTVVLLNVTGARRVLGRDPDAADEALGRAEEAGRDSLRSVRSIVGLLGTPGEGEGGAQPQPGAADIPGLVGTAAAAGLPVRSEVAGDLAAVDPYAGLAGYRLVQEALSNVEHHARGADVVVRVANEGDRLAVSVRNGPPAGAPAPARGGRAGTGLDGLRQRLGALGGSVSAGPEGDGWAVDGTIPLRRDAATEVGR